MHKLFSLGFIATLSTLGLAAPRSVAAVETTQPISISVSLATPGEIMQGEPVALNWLIKNNSPAPMSVETASDLMWCQFEIRNGDRLISEWSPQMRMQPGVSRLFIPVYELNTPVTIPVLSIPELTQVPMGNYTLHIHAKFIYGPSAFTRSTRTFGDRGTNREEDINIPITVKPMNDEVMKNRVSKLYKSIFAEADLPKREAMMETIAKMPGKYATRAWRSLLLNKAIPADDRYRFAYILSSVVSKPVVDVLFHVEYSDPIRDAEGRIVTLYNLLVGMEMSSPPEVKKYIKDEFKRHAGNPEVRFQIID